MKKFICFLFALSILVSFASENLVPAALSGFEDASQLNKVIYWYGSREIKLTDLESYTNRSSMAVWVNPPKKVGVYIPILKNVKANDVYTASAYVKGATKGGVSMYIYTTRNKKRVEAFFAPRRVDNVWQQIKLTGKLTKDADELGIILRSADKDFTFYVDNLALYAGKNAPGVMPQRIAPEKTAKKIDFITVPYTGKKVIFKGANADNTWNNALTLDRFYLTDGSGKAPRQKTVLKMLHDNKNLYLRFCCYEKAPKSIKNLSLPGAPVWNDERVELHFNSNGMEKFNNAGYFSVNSSGIYAFKNLDFSKSEVVCKPFTASDHWGLEIALPATTVGKSTLAGQLWKISSGRFCNTSGKETSSLAPIKGHFGNIPQAFKNFYFASPDEQAAICTSQGYMSVHENNSGNNRITFQIKQPYSTELKVISSHPDRKDIVNKYQSEKSKYPGFYYRVQGQSGEKLRFILTCNGKTLYDCTNELDVIEPAFRTYLLQDPLYEELLQDKPAELPRYSGSWQHPLAPENFEQAMKHGKAYSFEKRYQEIADAGISLEVSAPQPYIDLPLRKKGNYAVQKAPAFLERLLKDAENNQVPKPFLQGYYFITAQSPDGKYTSVSRDPNGFFSWIADPLTRAAYLAGTREMVRKYNKNMLGMWLGDEMLQLNVVWGKQMNKPHNLKNPSNFISKADEEVKSKYGFGKFGIPWSNLPVDEYTPYRNWAYISWMHDIVRKTGKEFYNIVKQHDPALLVRSYSNSGNPVTNGFEFAGELCDLLLVQLGEGGGTISPYMQNYAYWVKLAKDISGVKNVTAYPHECDSGYPTGAASEDEMLELYSQIFRAGGRSFSFWPASYGGRNRPAIYAYGNSEGYPLAWQYMLKMCKHIQTMPDLKFPAVCDTAIYISSDSLKCDLKGDTSAGVFTMLGPYARGWFKFVTDNTVNWKRDNLKNYKLVYLPYMQYTRPEAADDLIEYVKNGGTLICTDPLAFANNVDSTLLTGKRSVLFGIEVADRSPRYKAILLNGKTLPIKTDSVKIKLLDKNIEIIATFPDGTPAIVNRKLGKGKVIYYAFRVFSQEHLKPSMPWLEHIKNQHISLGGSVDHNIWRFRFPRMDVTLPEMPQGKCLTNNYAFFDRFKFNDGLLYNLDIKGKITIEYNGAARTLPFSESRLTDRRSVFYRTADYKKSYKNFVQDFSAAGKYTVTVKLDKAYDVDRLVYFYTGSHPQDWQINVLPENGNWQQISASAAGKTDALEIKRIHVPVQKKIRAVKILFSKKSESFIMPELELWSR